MALTKNDIINEVNDLGFTKKKSTEVVESLLEIIKSSLADGDDVLVSGFGKFCVKNKHPRRGRNPATGDDLMLKARKVVTFKCSGKLRSLINGVEPCPAAPSREKPDMKVEAYTD
ncbi:MAG: integration host factor subunit alpha [Desulfatitalea sp.]|nr:integration host factor subunit alpha [Desulfatitalea sp.]